MYTIICENSEVDDIIIKLYDRRIAHNISEPTPYNGAVMAKLGLRVTHTYIDCMI